MVNKHGVNDSLVPTCHTLLPTITGLHLERIDCGAHLLIGVLLAQPGE
jgi:hypothetical protein